MSDARREAPYRETEADRRYRELLRLLEYLAGDAWRMVHELDDVVGRRLCEAEDRGAQGAGR